MVNLTCLLFLKTFNCCSIIESELTGRVDFPLSHRIPILFSLTALQILATLAVV